MPEIWKYWAQPTGHMNRGRTVALHHLTEFFRPAHIQCVAPATACYDGLAGRRSWNPAGPFVSDTLRSLRSTSQRYAGLESLS